MYFFLTFSLGFSLGSFFMACIHYYAKDNKYQHAANQTKQSYPYDNYK